MTKHCIDCAHFVRHPKLHESEYGYCGVAIKKGDINDKWAKWAVTGQGDEPVKDELFSCVTERSLDMPNHCGPNGKRFVPKEQEVAA